jgi:hypothetical protein
MRYIMRIVILVLATVLSLESGRAVIAYAQPPGGCDGTGSAASAAECRAGQRIFQDLNVFVDGVANRVAAIGIAAFDASIQSAGQELAGRASITITNVEAALQGGSAESEVLLSSIRGLLDESDRVLSDADKVVSDGNEVVDDAEDVLDETKDVLDDSEKILKRTTDLLKRAEPLLVAGEEAEQRLRKRIDQAEARVADVVTRLRESR